MSHRLQAARPHIHDKHQRTVRPACHRARRGIRGADVRPSARTHVRVSLVEPGGLFTERIRSHERAAGRPDDHPSTARVPGPGRYHARPGAGHGHRARAPARSVPTTAGSCATTGSSTRSAAGPPAWRIPAGRVFTPESAAELHQRLQDRRTPAGSLAVVGGGLTGIELAAEIAEAEPRWAVRLITAGWWGQACLAAAAITSAGYSPPAECTWTRGARSRRRTRWRRTWWCGPGPWPPAAGSPRPRLAMTAGGSRWARAALGLPSRDLRRRGRRGLGQSGRGPLRMACATGLPTGAHAAQSVLADLRGGEPAPLRFRIPVRQPRAPRRPDPAGARR